MTESSCAVTGATTGDCTTRGAKRENSLGFECASAEASGATDDRGREGNEAMRADADRVSVGEYTTGTLGSKSADSIGSAGVTSASTTSD